MRALLLAALFVAGAAASDGRDDASDAPAAYDVLGLDWHLHEGANVTFHLAGAPDDAGAYTAILFIGQTNDTEPEEWYVVHAGPDGDAVLAGHASTAVSSYFERNGTEIRAVFDRVDPSTASCHFAVARTAVPVTGGQDEQDTAPDGVELANGWNDGAYCLEAPEEHEHHHHEEGLPGVSLLFLIVGLIWLARR